MLVLALLACQPEPEPEPQDEAPPALPEIWGVDAAVDHDDDPNVVEVRLTAAESEVTWVDGTETDVWAYDGQIPGPLLQARVGDTLRVVFTNDLPEETTIHWHGLRIPAAMDGVPMLQDPVQPGETFTYEFVLPDPGSFWYHPHVRSNEQIERGLQGLLVVHEAEPIEVDRERYFAVDDVAVSDTTGRLSGFSLTGMDAMHGRHGNVLLVNGAADVLEDTVAAGTVERWRVVNTANARTMWLDVTGARWRVVAIDGTLLEDPFDLGANDDPLLLPVGRRFDLEVMPDAAAEQVQLLVKLPSSEGGWAEYPVFEAPIEGDAGFPNSPRWNAPALPEVATTEQEIDLVLGADTSGSTLKWTINGEVFDEGSMIPVQANVPTLLRIEETSGLEHPFHLHGQFFRQLSRTGRSDDVPGRLDTLLIDGGETVELYTTFDNPGTWMAHCHILEHAELGMMTTLDVQE